MDVLVLIGRILFASLFLQSAVGHLTQSKGMAGYAQHRGVPANLAQPVVLVTGVQLALGGLMVLLGIWADLGALLLAAFLIPTAIIMHGFWRETDQQARMMEMVQFNKDLALGGASLALFAFFAHVDDLGLTITGPLFSLN
jgi:putative oxidoreductase